MTHPTQAEALAAFKRLVADINPDNGLPDYIKADSETVRKSGETDQLHGKIVGRWSLGSRKRPWI